VHHSSQRDNWNIIWILQSLANVVFARLFLGANKVVKNIKHNKKYGIVQVENNYLDYTWK
jgi:hypothetical protein